MKLETVGDYIKKLQEFPLDWPVKISTQAGGGIAIEHREIKGSPVVAVFGSNGGMFGENPLTEEEYKKRALEFLAMWNDESYAYTSIHGDHRMYCPGLRDATCYGQHFDRRVVERLVNEGLIPKDKVDIDRVKYLST